MVWWRDQSVTINLKIKPQDGKELSNYIIFWGDNKTRQLKTLRRRNHIKRASPSNAEEIRIDRGSRWHHGRSTPQPSPVAGV